MIELRLLQCDPDDRGANYVSKDATEHGYFVKLQYRPTFAPHMIASGDIVLYALTSSEWLDVPVVEQTP